MESEAAEGLTRSNFQDPRPDARTFMGKVGLVLFTDSLFAKLLAHEQAVVAGLGAASRLFITD